MAAINLGVASPANASNNSYINFVIDSSGDVQTVALDNTAADFGSMNSLSWTVEYSLQLPRNNDVYILGIRIVNGGTILAAGTAGGAFQTVSSSVTSTTDTTSPSTAFSYINTGANKATWDGATVELEQTINKSQGFDGTGIRVDYVTFSGDYSSSPVTMTDGAITESTVDSASGSGSVTGLANILQQGNADVTEGFSDSASGSGTVTPFTPATQQGTANVTEAFSDSASGSGKVLINAEPINITETTVDTFYGIETIPQNSFYVNMPVGYLGFYVNMPADQQGCFIKL